MVSWKEKRWEVKRLVERGEKERERGEGERERGEREREREDGDKQYTENLTRK